MVKDLGWLREMDEQLEITNSSEDTRKNQSSEMGSVVGVER